MRERPTVDSCCQWICYDRQCLSWNCTEQFLQNKKLLSNTLACMGSTSGYALNADEGRTGSDAFLLSLGYSLYCARYHVDSSKNVFLSINIDDAHKTTAWCGSGSYNISQNGKFLLLEMTYISSATSPGVVVPTSQSAWTQIYMSINVSSNYSSNHSSVTAMGGIASPGHVVTTSNFESTYTDEISTSLASTPNNWTRTYSPSTSIPYTSPSVPNNATTSSSNNSTVAYSSTTAIPENRSNSIGTENSDETPQHSTASTLSSSLSPDTSQSPLVSTPISSTTSILPKVQSESSSNTIQDASVQSSSTSDVPLPSSSTLTSDTRSFQSSSSNSSPPSVTTLTPFSLSASACNNRFYKLVNGTCIQDDAAIDKTVAGILIGVLTSISVSVLIAAIAFGCSSLSSVSSTTPTAPPPTSPPPAAPSTSEIENEEQNANDENIYASQNNSTTYAKMTYAQNNNPTPRVYPRVITFSPNPNLVMVDSTIPVNKPE